MDTLPATGLLASSWLLIALPLAGAAVLLLGGRRTDRWGHLLGTATVVAAFVLGLLCTVQLAGLEEARVDVDLFTFIASGDLDVRAGLLYDPLSATFVLLITGVGSLIHIYSIGYMAHDPGRRRFFAYLNLFVAAMLLLVLGNNFVALYVGWEGVGLASYLLIAFWYTRPAAATAAKKAFIMNRVGDVGLALAIFLMFAQLGHRVLRGRLRSDRHAGRRHRHRDRAAAPARRVRQVRPVPAAGVAARRHGGPDPGLGADPRRDHGHRRRLPDRPLRADLRRDRRPRAPSSWPSAR